MTLYDSTIKGAKPSDKPYKLQDGKGMYVLVNPNGSKYFRFDYRFGGKRKTLAIGIYGDSKDTLKLKDARERTEEARVLLQKGIDPSRKQRLDNSKRQNEFKEVFARWLESNRNFSDKYRQHVTSRINNHVIPFIGDTSMADIDREQLIAIIDRIKTKKLHSSTVGKIFGYISSVFKYSIAEAICTRNLAEDVRPLLPTGDTTTSRKALDDKAIPDFLRKLEDYGGRYETIVALKLLMWTANRPQEIFASMWREFDLDACLWSVPIERMKKKRLHLVPLPIQTVEALRELYSITGSNKFLFPNQNDKKKHMGVNTLNDAIKNMGFDATAHGMRSVFSTAMNTQGFRSDVIEISLSHVDASVRGIYNRADYLDERRRMMQSWADYLDALKNGAEVIPFKAKAV